jgi:protein-disulfide isomerase
VDERILAQLAERAGIDPERVLQDAVDALPPVTEAEVTAFYEGHPRAFSGGPDLAAQAPQIREFLERERRAKAMRALRGRATVELDLPAPYDHVAEGVPARGPEAAPVTIVAFTDFACLDCARAEAVLAALRERYPDEVRLVYRYVPREDASFRHGREAAEAAVCAQRLGADWAYHDALFEHQRDLAAEDLEAYARAGRLDAGALADCRAAGDAAARMQADARAAEAAGVSRLPAFLVNGQLVSGPRSLPVFSGLVENARRQRGFDAERG